MSENMAMGTNELTGFLDQMRYSIDLAIINSFVLFNDSLQVDKIGRIHR